MTTPAERGARMDYERERAEARRSRPGDPLRQRALQLDARDVAVTAAAAAVVRVDHDGALTVACSCGAPLDHPSGRAKYALDRLTSHMGLHATAAAAGIPWTEVQARQQRLRDDAARGQL